MKTIKIDMTDYLEICNPAIIAEVGVMAGKVSKYLLSRIQSVEKLYMIDPWTEYDKMGQSESKDKRLLAYDQNYWDNMYNRAVIIAGKYGNRAEVIRKTSFDAAKGFEDSTFDVVVIDADHTYLSVLIDIMTWLPKLKDGGIFVSHDYSSGWRDVVRAIDDVFGGDFTRLNHSYIAVELDKELKVRYTDIAKGLVG